MKLTDRAKKRLTIAGLGVVCIVLVIAIASQFKTEEPRDAALQPSSPASDVVSPGTPGTDSSGTQEVNANPIDSSEVPDQSTDTGNSTGTDQNIQSEVTKPPEPSQEAKTNPSQKPDGEKVDKSTPAATKPDSNTSSSTPKSGDKNDKGQVWVPGFGWVDNSGDNVGTKADDMYENGNKIGDMD